MPRRGALKASSGATPVLDCVGGPEKGSSYSLLEDQLTIGRTDDNDLVLVSDSVSRLHAVVSRQLDNSFIIQDQGSKNGVLVNGERVEECLLEDGDILQVGEFLFRFGQMAASQEALAPIEEEEAFEAPVVTKQRRSGGAKVNGRVILYGLVGLVIVGVLMFNQEEETATKGSEETTSEEEGIGVGAATGIGVKSPIRGLEDPVLTRAEQELNKFDFDDPNIREAEQYFRKGQREHWNKNYHRAIRDFQTSLSFNRRHPLAKRYLDIVMKGAEEEAKVHMEAGIKYYQSLQYSRAMYHFKQVPYLLRHKREDKRVIEAERYFNFCEKRLRAAELFP